MSFSLDTQAGSGPALALARVRNMLSDVGNGTPGGGTEGVDYFLSDERIHLFLACETDASLSEADNARLAAAAALDALATNEAYVQKVQRLPGLETDGARTSQAIRGHAAALRQQVKEARDRSLRDAPPGSHSFVVELMRPFCS